MTAAPDPTLADAMLARAGDLAHYMLQRDRVIAVASGHTPNGIPCTVVYAIGDQAEMMRDVAAKVVEWAGRQRDDAAKIAQQN